MRKKIKFNIIAFIAALLFIFIKPVDFSKASSNETFESQEFRVGMEANYPPFNWTQNENLNDSVLISKSKQFAGGYDVKIANLIAKELGKKLVIVKTEWDGLLMALTSGKIDAIIAGMSPTKSRQEVIDFSDNYYTSDLVVLVKKGSRFENASSIYDFSSAKVTAQLNTLHYDAIDQIPNVIKQSAMDNFPAMRVSLASGVIDCYVTEKPEAQTAEKLNKNFKMIEFDQKNGFKLGDSREFGVSIGVRKNDPNLNIINSILSKISNEQRKEFMLEATKNQPTNNIGKNWFFQIIKENGNQLLSGALMTLFISMIGTVVGGVIGLIVGTIRVAEVPKNSFLFFVFKIFSWFIVLYVEIFRGTPMIIQSVVLYYGTSQLFGFNVDRTIAALLIVSINTGAYMSEIFRSGINSVEIGQFEAAKAIGVPYYLTMKKIILPQVIKKSIPLFGNEFIINVKDTAVLNVISVSELFFEAKTIAGQNFHFFQTFFIVSIIYFIMTYSFTKFLYWIDHKTSF